jgi:transcription elongation factor GreA
MTNRAGKARTITKNDLPRIQLTEEGHAKFQADFDRLTKERPEVLIRLQAAREMGDLSENGAYHAARFELSTIDRQLKKLTYQLRFAEITKTKKTGVADFGSTITLDNNGKTMTFTLVSGYESDPQNSKLSVYSPIGQAVMGKKAGETVTVDAPAGKITLKLISIT